MPTWSPKKIENMNTATFNLGDICVSGDGLDSLDFSLKRVFVRELAEYEI